MKALVVFLVALALGSANPIGPTTYTEPSRDELIRSTIDNNVLWLLSGVRNGSFEGPDLPSAVLALFLAEPGFFSPGNEIGRELRDKIKTALTEHIRQARIQEALWTDRYPWRRTQRSRVPSFISSEKLAPFVQALLVSCVDPYDFLGHDLTAGLWKSVLLHHCERGECNFPSSAMLALCNARATAYEDFHEFLGDAMDTYGGISYSMRLTDDEAFLPMTFGCFEYPYPRDNVTITNTYIVQLKETRLRYPFFLSSGYKHYPFNLTVEDFRELMRQEGHPMENTTSLSAIAAAMQNLMYIHRLRVSDLPSAVDFLLRSQDEDGSWGQSALNSFFVLPVLSNRSFLDINSDHCPEGSSENGWLVKVRRVVINVLDGDLKAQFFRTFNPSATLYDVLFKGGIAYQNGTDGKPYILSIENKEDNPETGYFWFTYEQTRWPKESLTLLTQSHDDIILKPNRRYLLWYRKKSEEEAQNDEI